MNQLYYGDNLDVLRRHVADESVDLVYLDPPFKSNQDYNVLFAERDGTRSAAQIQAFEDTWRWDQEAAREFAETVEAGAQVAQVMLAFRTFLGESDMLAYLSMMAPRLIELRRVLRSTGSIYLHCDPAASHYLKMLMDAVFGPAMFRNEIIWKRTQAHGSSHRYGPVHDTLLFFTRSDDYTWTDARLPHSANYINKKFTYSDADGRLFQPITLTGAGVRRGESGQPWRGVNPTEKGRHWALPREASSQIGADESASVQERLNAMDDAGLIYWPEKRGGQPRFKWYADQLRGAAIPDVWTDIDPLNSQARERLGYPTQKPEQLLERIIEASSTHGEVVLDPFCGCGTAVAVAQRLERQWIGIDITHLAIGLIKHRLKDQFGDEIAKTFDVIGEPTAVSGAEELAADDPYQFQWWALGLVGARPVEQEKGADKGIDGRRYFHDEGPSGPTKQVIFSVKAGHVTVAHVRDLRGVLDREKAAMGVLISLEEPTKPMRTEAASADFYDSPWSGKHPRLQLITVGELLAGKTLDTPPLGQIDISTFKKAPRHYVDPVQRTLDLIAAEAPAGKTIEPKRSRNAKKPRR